MVLEKPEKLGIFLFYFVATLCWLGARKGVGLHKFCHNSSQEFAFGGPASCGVTVEK